MSSVDYILSDFEWLPTLGEYLSPFSSSLKKITVVEGGFSSSVYKIDVPNDIMRKAEAHTKSKSPLIVFYPRYDGYDDLDRVPKKAYGGIAVQMVLDGSSKISRSDFEVIAQCVAVPNLGSKLGL